MLKDCRHKKVLYTGHQTSVIEYYTQRALLNGSETFSFDCITSDHLTKFNDVTPCLYQSSYEKGTVYFLPGLCVCAVQVMSLQAQGFVKFGINYPCFSFFLSLCHFFSFPFSFPLPSTCFLYGSGICSVCYQGHSKYYRGIPSEHFMLYLYILLVCFSTLSQVQSISCMPSVKL